MDQIYSSANSIPGDEALDILHEISALLGAGLDKELLSIVVQLCELGVNPIALSEVIIELRNEAKRCTLNQQSENTKKKKDVSNSYRSMKKDSRDTVENNGDREIVKSSNGYPYNDDEKYVIHSRTSSREKYDNLRNEGGPVGKGKYL